MTISIKIALSTKIRLNLAGDSKGKLKWSGTIWSQYENESNLVMLLLRSRLVKIKKNLKMVLREYAAEKTYLQASHRRAQRPLTLYFLLWPIFVKRHHMKFQPLIHGLASTQVPWCTKNCIKRASSSLMSSYKSKR